ncbi:rod-binding protein [Nitrospira sp. Kam-Ns4a]
MPRSDELARPALATGLPAERSLRASDGGSRAEIRKAAQAFEAYFVAYLMKVMRETVPKGILPSRAADHYSYFYDQEIGQLAAQAGGLGLAKFLEENLASDSVMPANASIQDNAGPWRPPG